MKPSCCLLMRDVAEQLGRRRGDASFLQVFPKIAMRYVEILLHSCERSFIIILQLPSLFTSLHSDCIIQQQSTHTPHNKKREKVAQGEPKVVENFS